MKEFFHRFFAKLEKFSDGASEHGERSEDKPKHAQHAVYNGIAHL